MEDMHSFPVGSTIGSFEVLQKIGKNSAGEVYLVKHSLLNQKRVVRTVFCGHVFAEQVSKEKYLQRIAAALDVRDPHLVELFNVSQDSSLNMIFTVAEYMENGSLLDYLTRYAEKNTVSLVMDVAERITAAIAVISKHGMVHGNINLSNIMVSGDEKIKLADWGLGVVPDSDTPLQSPFDAPETFEGKGDFRSDIYSLGMCLYLLAAGRLPYRSREFFQRLAAEGLPEPVTLCESVAPVLNNFVVKLTALNPDERPQSVAELQQLILETKQDLGLIPRNTTSPGSVPKLSLKKNNSALSAARAPLGGRKATPPPVSAAVKHALASSNAAAEKTIELSSYATPQPSSAALSASPQNQNLQPPSMECDRQEEEFVIDEVAMRQQFQPEIQKFSWKHLPFLFHACLKSVFAMFSPTFFALKNAVVWCFLAGFVAVYGINYAQDFGKKTGDKEDLASKAWAELQEAPDAEKTAELKCVLAQNGDWDSLLPMLNDENGRVCLDSLKKEDEPDALLIAATAMMLQNDGTVDEKEYLSLMESAAEKGSIEAIGFLRSWYKCGKDEVKIKKYQQMYDEFFQKMKEDK